MGRNLATTAVVLANALLLVANHYALTGLTGVTYVLLIVAAYQAGKRMVSQVDVAVVVGTNLGGLAALALIVPAIPQIVVGHLVFAALPLLVGRYLAQQRRLMSALDQHNRYLRRERQLLAEREQLRERLRIARDVHDSLGHRLSLVTVQAAALEAAGLPARHRQAAEAVGDAARGAVRELYQLVGSLRGMAEETPGAAGIGGLVTGFRSAGMPVTLTEHGEPRPLPAATDTAAYRTVEEGLTNAAKHAPDAPVSVHVAWEPDALVLTVTNPVGDDPGDGSGSGLAGLRERIEPAGGLLDHRVDSGRFRLVAMLPCTTAESPERAPNPWPGRMLFTAIGIAAWTLMLVVLPVGILSGG